MEQRTTVLPLVALRGLTVVPGMIMHFDLNREMSKKAIEQALNHEQKVLLVPQVDQRKKIQMKMVYIMYVQWQISGRLQSFQMILIE